MKNLVLCALALSSSLALADESAPARATGADFASPVQRDTSDGREVAGAVLMGLSAASAMAATATGAIGIMGVPGHICGLTEESCTDHMNAVENRFLYAAIGLSAVAVIAGAIGTPLYVAGHDAKKRRMSFAVAPTYSAQGAGVAGSLSVRF